MTSCDDLSRRRVLIAGGALGAALVSGLAPRGAQAQAPTTTAKAQTDSQISDALAAEFLQGAVPVAAGLALELPVLADNPSAVPVRVHVTEALTEALWCEEIILLAERNPAPLACRLRFSPLAGSADVAVRLRLIETMRLRALARMSDGRFLEARAEITVAAGGCGM